VVTLEEFAANDYNLNISATLIKSKVEYEVLTVGEAHPLQLAP
jgi:hypothetical protein